MKDDDEVEGGVGGEGPELNLEELLRTADDQYEQIVSFREWAEGVDFDEGNWGPLRLEMVRAKEEGTDELFERSRQIVSRVAAVETGELENLYEPDRGFTFTIAFESAVAAKAMLDSVSQSKRDLIRSQLEAYELVIDFVTKNRPIAQAWIRELHSQVCAGQETYQVWTGSSFVERPLEKGAYKEHPNHVRTQDDTLHAYAPVSDTPSEMQALCDEMASEEFGVAHPVVQAAYAHHALTHIHPFPDGNGRVARALASVFTYRKAWVPALIATDEKEGYWDALEAADAGRPTPFTNVVRRGAERAMELFLAALEAASGPTVGDLTESIASLYVTSGGYTHAQVDDASMRLLTAAKQAFDHEIPTGEGLGCQVGLLKQTYDSAVREGYRGLVKSRGFSTIEVTMSTASPAGAKVRKELRLEVPRDCGSDTPIYLHDPKGGLEFTMPANEIIPQVSEFVHMRLRIFAGQTFKAMLEELSSLARSSLRASGF